MITLFPHQQEALNQTEGFQNIAVYHDMGLGKTFTGSEMMKRFGCKVNLIVCQKSKIQDWIDHFNKHYDTIVYDLTNKKDMETFMFENDYRPIDGCVGVINYELAWRRKDLLNLENFTLMLDESSLIQNASAKQTKFILKLKPAHVILLSGTPVGGKYENLWTQIHLLGWKISEDLYKKQYVNWKLTEDDGSGIRHKIVDMENPYKNVDRLKSKMRDHGAVFKKTEECFDLPDQVFTQIRVKASKEYWKFKKSSIVRFNDKGWTDKDIELIGDTTLTKMLYERQICSQYNESKLQAFGDLLQSNNERLIVFYNFNEELVRLKTLCQLNGRPTSEINGHVKDLTALKECENAVCLCQYQSASKGLNLQEYGCNKIIYFSLPLSSEDFEQSKKRIHRIGQNETCFYYLMICQGTIEERVIQTLEERKDFTDELFEENKKN